jgi:carboxymethylenebutenolidase
MSRTELTITAPGGRCPASLHVPDGNGPFPGIVLFADGGGVRETHRLMADRLAALGYAVLVPDVYYRAGAWAPFDMATVFGDPVERPRLLGLAAQLTAEKVAADAQAYVEALLARPESYGPAVGVTGYCMGGTAALIAAGVLGERVAAAASFHGGNLAAADDPGSPHHRAGHIRATVYVAAARGDASFPPEQADRLAAALTDAEVPHTIETYPAEHGFAVPDMPTHDAQAEERHWAALADLFGSALTRA